MISLTQRKVKIVFDLNPGTLRCVKKHRGPASVA
jgi:hypothetical protein